MMGHSSPKYTARVMEPQPNRRILVVDDEADLTHFLALMIGRRTGHEVEQAASATQALKMMKEREFHLVVTDIHMPGMNGLELLREVKSAYPDTEVIMLTGQGSLDSAVGALQMQAYDYIEKPVNSDRLVQAVRNALAQQSLSAELTRTIAQVAHLNRDLKRQVRDAQHAQAPRERLATAAVIAGYLERAGGSAITGSPAFQKLRANLERRRPKLALTDVSELVQNGCREIGAIYPKIEVVVDLPASPILTCADATGLANALRIIVTNAVRAMNEKGGLAVGARVVDGHVEIGVRDRGPGFTAQALADLEEPLAGADGTGLGLLIAREVAHAHNGTLTMTNTSDGGAVVALRLPLTA